MIVVQAGLKARLYAMVVLPDAWLNYPTKLDYRLVAVNEPPPLTVPLIELPSTVPL
jgi:hypothetical protein